MVGNKGTFGFSIILLCLNLGSCRAQQSGIEFYEGLKKRHTGAEAEAVVCFEKALNADNSCIAAAAAAELMSLHSAGLELPAAIMVAMRKKVAGFWASVLSFTDADMKRKGQNTRALNAIEAREKEAFLELLFTGDSRSSVDMPFIGSEAAQYALRIWRDDSGLSFTEAEHAAIDGRIAASRSRYNEALLFFRIALSESPKLFFRYPDLLVDLGRTFQYTGAGREGMDLFLQWERIFDDKAATPREDKLKAAIPPGSENLVRFRLLFFAARIARQRSESGGNSIELFEKALPFARDIPPEQDGSSAADACIWYILDSSLAAGPAQTIQYLGKYCSQWSDDDYFFDVLDKLARECMLKRQWDNILSVCKLLQNRRGAAAAHYAWISGRLMEEGLFSPPEAESAEAYIRITYNASGNGVGMALYYRSLSVAALGEAFAALPETAPPDSAGGDSEALQFLMGFFEHDAVQFAVKHIRAMEKELSAEELRRVAKALGAAGQYQESIRLVSLYVKRSGYQITKSDLELLYPRPFKEPVERYAGETGIEPALLYGLIRTESAFDSSIVSRAGAVGLSQLMPATAEEMASRIRRRGGPNYIQTSVDEDSPAVIDLSDPAVNIHIGATYLAWLNERMDDPLLALLAYNGGMNRIRRWRTAVNRSTGNLPPDLFLETIEYTETRNYGRSVMGAAALYKELYY